MRLIDELKRRNVFRIAGTYCVVTFAFIELVPNLVDAFGLPAWSTTFVFLMLALGFPIVILVTWAFEMTPEGLRRTEDVDQHRKVILSSAKLGDYALLVAIIAAVGYMSYTVNMREGGSQMAGMPVINTVAVLPFANLSVEPEQEGMSRAITSDVRNRLAKVASLKVVAGPASQKPGDDEDIHAIGKKLDAPVVLDGSVQRSGAKLRVMAQLIDTENGVQLWSKTFDREMADMLVVQDDLAQSIVDDVRKIIMPPAVSDAEAQDAGSQANKLLNSGRSGLAQRTEASLVAATSAFEQAIMRDPKSAPAHAALAEALLLQGRTWETYGQMPLADAVARARPFANKALELDPKLADARAVSGLIDLASGNTAAAIASLAKAVEQKPDLAKARLWLYQAYAATGRFDEGVDQLRKAHELDPTSLAIGLNMALFLALSDHRLEADMLLDRLDALYPDNENLLAARGARLADDWRPADAIQLLGRANKANPADERVRSMIGLAYLDLGAASEAAQWLDARDMVLLAQGRPADALAEARKRFAADPADQARVFALADAEAAAGHSKAAAALLSPFEALSNDGTGPLYGRSPLAMPALTLAGARLALGDTAGARPLLEGARTWLARQRAMGFEHPKLVYLEARIDALDGKQDDAMDALRRAVSQRFAGVSVVGWDPALASLRARPDYVSLVADLDSDRLRRRARLKDMGLLASL
ncbi:tetratricopeptide repeat protein [Emcibacter sp. SYSU 3D8]|uniref:tetratricopeptide repeat protein n=1 Tax=Emcibacter sp. SYSU 3D8 TaxID=3133969 RepID=UPI0031FE4825